MDLLLISTPGSRSCGTACHSGDAASHRSQQRLKPPHTLCRIITDNYDNLISLKLPYYSAYVHGVIIPTYKRNNAFSPGKQIKAIQEERQLEFAVTRIFLKAAVFFSFFYTLKIEL